MSSKIAQALIQRRAFALTQCSLLKDGGKYAVTIDQDFRLETTPAGRKALEQDKGQKYRWAAGGGLMVLDCLDCTVALVRHRDAGAPSYGNHWTLGSGLSSTFDELVDVNRLIVREAIEEFIVATPDGLIIPVSPDKDFNNEVSFGAVASGRHIRMQACCTGMLSSSKYLEAETHFQALPGQVEIEVGFEDEEGKRVSRGLLCRDEGTRGIDLLRVIRVKVPFCLSELAIYDGEEDREGKPLNAVVGCLKVKGERIFPEFANCFQNGRALSDYQLFNNKMTPPLKAVFWAMT